MAGKDEIYFEFRTIGNMVRATAIDPTTGLEATITGPTSASQRDLQTLALRRLQGLIAQRSGGPAPPRR